MDEFGEYFYNKKYNEIIIKKLKKKLEREHELVKEYANQKIELIDRIQNMNKEIEELKQLIECLGCR
jgi:hypothetical protein